MELHQIRYFLALSETLNFTKAAEACNVTQPSLTRAVQKLEEELGGALVARERSQTHLTELGRIMKPKLSDVLYGAQTAKAAAAAFHGNEQASIRLGLSETVDAAIAASPLKELARAISSLEIRLCRDDGPSLLKFIEEGEVDVVIAGGLDSSWNRLERWPLFDEGFSLLVPANDALAAQKEITVDKILGLGLLPRSFCEDTDRITKSVVGDLTVSPALHETPSEGDLAAFVEFGLGYAIAPNSTRVSENIAKIPIGGEVLDRSVYVYGVAGRQRSPACSTLIKLLRTIDWSTRVPFPTAA